ncbi:MAG: DUF1385 domain-containing protein, partial [archaeon]
MLIDMLILGMKAITFSANASTDDKEEELSNWEIFFTLLFAFAIALLIFKFLPLWLSSAFQAKTNIGNFWFNLMDGLLKIFFLIIYIWLISRMKEVQRMFEYHGAEHKAVHTYEAGKKLTVKNVKKYGCAHDRCGTAFILIVFFVSIIFYMFIPAEFSLGQKYLWRILLLPIIAGVSYEIIKLASKHHDKMIFKWILKPGLVLQRLTTKTPDDKQIEVGIAALKAVLKKEKVKF